jgi:hypothetical protein
VVSCLWLTEMSTGLTGLFNSLNIRLIGLKLSP